MTSLNPYNVPLYDKVYTQCMCTGGLIMLNIGPGLASKLFVVSQIINVHLPLQIGFSVSTEKNVVYSQSVEPYTYRGSNIQL